MCNRAPTHLLVSFAVLVFLTSAALPALAQDPSNIDPVDRWAWHPAVLMVEP